MSAMKDQAQTRLAELKREYQLGEGQLGELARREAALRELMQRIAGAIQVLEELLAADAGQVPGDASLGETTSGEAALGAAPAPDPGTGSLEDPALLTVP